MMEDMIHLLESLRDRPSVRTLVLQAAEGSRAFSSGVEVAEHGAERLREMIHTFAVLQEDSEVQVVSGSVLDCQFIADHLYSVSKIALKKRLNR